MIRRYSNLRDMDSFQTWPGQFLMREIETNIIKDLFRFRKDQIGLEIGCGVGFQSSLIASMSKRIVATDLFDPNSFTHTVGMNKAKELLRSTGTVNIDLVSCCAEKLPFKDENFDFVFSSSVLEHVKDKSMVISEMKRVTKKGGYIIAIVPNFLLSVYAFVHLPLYITKRAVNVCLNKIFRVNAKTELSGVTTLKSLKQKRPSFPLPEPHGSYKNIFYELCDYFPRRWKKNFIDSGLSIVLVKTTCFLPWSILEVFSSRIGAEIYKKTQNIHRKFNIPVSSSYLFCIIAKKAE